jgi:hypothetical protein
VVKAKAVVLEGKPVEQAEQAPELRLEQAEVMKFEPKRFRFTTSRYRLSYFVIYM